MNEFARPPNATRTLGSALACFLIALAAGAASAEDSAPCGPFEAGPTGIVELAADRTLSDPGIQATSSGSAARDLGSIVPLPTADPSESAPGKASVHGTLMAGVIGAAENNGFGIAGLAPKARIVSIPICTAKGGAGGHAPGVEVLSTVPGSAFAFGSGTSLAAAHVTGSLAVLTGITGDAKRARSELFRVVNARAATTLPTLRPVCDVLLRSGRECGSEKAKPSSSTAVPR